MTSFRLKSLRTFRIIIGIIIVFLLGVSVVIYFNLRKYIENAEHVNHSSLTLKEIETIMGAVKDAQTAHRGFELTGDSVFVRTYNEDRSRIIKTIDRLAEILKADEQGSRKLDTLEKLITKQFEITKEVMGRKQEGGGIDDRGVILLQSDEENMTKIVALVNRMRKAEEVWLLKDSSEENWSDKLTPIFVLSSFIIAIVVLYFLFLQLYKTIKVKNATENELEKNLKLLSEEVNERELAQESLKRVLDSTTNGVTFYKAIRNNGKIKDLRIVLANEQTRKIIGIAPEELEGETILTKFPGVKETGLFEKYIDVIESGKPLDTEVYYNYDGLNKWFRLTANKLEDGCVISIADISQRKEYEEELIKKNEALLESNHNLEQFAYVASHDLQEPLRKIRTFSDRVVTKYRDKLDDKGRDYMDRMNGAAERMQSLIDDLLKFSRISRTSKELQKVDLNELIETIKIDFETLFEERSVDLNVNKLEPIEGDKTQLRQLFQNLISNGIKFTPKDKSPVISITGQKTTGVGQNEFNLKSKKHYLKIEVKDNGIGFDQKYADRIFNIFERLHGKSEIEGTGIGLAVCHKVVKNHKGFIKAESKEGEGARFIILLPLKHN